MGAGSQVDTKKCKRGCLCIKKSDYYSGCKPPPGSQFCDVEAAKGFVKRADNVYNRKKAIENHKKQISDSKWDVLQTKKKKTKDLEDALETAEEEKAAAKKEANLEMIKSSLNDELEKKKTELVDAQDKLKDVQAIDTDAILKDRKEKRDAAAKLAE